MLQIVKYQTHLRLMLSLTMLGRTTGVIIVVHLKAVILMRETMIKEATPTKKVGAAFVDADAGIVGTNESPLLNETSKKLAGVRVAEGVVGHTVQMAERTGGLHQCLARILNDSHPLLHLDIMVIVLRLIHSIAVPKRMNSVAICDHLHLPNLLILVLLRTNTTVPLQTHPQCLISRNQSSHLRLQVMTGCLDRR